MTSEKEIEESSKMIKWLSENIDKLPALMQLKYYVALMEMVEKVKPLYLQAMLLRGENDEKAETV